MQKPLLTLTLQYFDVYILKFVVYLCMFQYYRRSVNLCDGHKHSEHRISHQVVSHIFGNNHIHR